MKFEELEKVEVCPRSGKLGLCLSLDWSKDRWAVLGHSSTVYLLTLLQQSAVFGGYQ